MEGNFILPLGTFQQISYLINNSQKSRQEHNFTEYAFYVSFFPQLIAGPIIKFNDMIHQIKSQKIVKKNIFYHKAFIGIIILSIGLVKKVYLQIHYQNL